MERVRPRAATSAPTMCPRRPVPCAIALLLLLLLSEGALHVQAAPLTGELRCQCVQTMSEAVLHRHIISVLLLPEGPHCDVSEVIATLKNGQKICLNTTADWVKLVIRRIVRSASTLTG